jgi:hypothetical protein
MPINLDVHRIAPTTAFSLISPIIPGGILVLGGVLTRQDLRLVVLGGGTTAEPWRIGIAIFCAYVFGLLLNAILGSLSWISGFIAGYCLYGKAGPKIPEAWKSTVWRKVARQFLGDMAPPLVEPFYPETFEYMRKQVEQVPDPQTRAQLMTSIGQQALSLQAADIEWNQWYQVLRAGFLKNDQSTILGLQILDVLFASGWAAIIVLSFTPLKHWFLWAMACFAVLVGLLAGIMRAWYQQDLYGTELTATLLKQIRRKESN